jgi:hypothetical protein
MCEEALESMYHSMSGGDDNIIVLKLLARSCWSQTALGEAYWRPNGRGAGYSGGHRGGPSRGPLKPTSPRSLGRAGPGRKLGGAGNMPS